jgi:hypothetical protein
MVCWKISSLYRNKYRSSKSICLRRKFYATRGPVISRVFGIRHRILTVQDLSRLMPIHPWAVPFVWSASVLLPLFEFRCQAQCKLGLHSTRHVLQIKSLMTGHVVHSFSPPPRELLGWAGPYLYVCRSVLEATNSWLADLFKPIP